MKTGNPRSLGSWCIKGTEESTLDNGFVGSFDAQEEPKVSLESDFNSAYGASLRNLRSIIRHGYVVIELF